MPEDGLSGLMDMVPDTIDETLEQTVTEPATVDQPITSEDAVLTDAAPSFSPDDWKTMKDELAAARDQLKQRELAEAELRGMFMASQRAPQEPKKDEPQAPQLTPEQQAAAYGKYVEDWTQAAKQRMLKAMPAGALERLNQELVDNPLAAIVEVNAWMMRQALDAELSEFSRRVGEHLKTTVDGAYQAQQQNTQQQQWRDHVDFDSHLRLATKFPAIREYFTALTPEEQTAFTDGLVSSCMNSVAGQWKNADGTAMRAEQVLDLLYQSGDDGRIDQFLDAVGQTVLARRGFLSQFAPAAAVEEAAAVKPKPRAAAQATRPSSRTPAAPVREDDVLSMLERH